MNIEQIKDEQLRYDAQYSNPRCTACKREIHLAIEKVYDYGGTICKECYQETGELIKGRSK